MVTLCYALQKSNQILYQYQSIQTFDKREKKMIYFRIYAFHIYVCSYTTHTRTCLACLNSTGNCIHNRQEIN